MVRCVAVVLLLAAAMWAPSFMAPPAAPRSVNQLSLGTTDRQHGSDGNLQGGLVAISVAGAVGVVLAQRQFRSSRHAEGKINNKITPEVPKVVTKEDLKTGDKKVYCRCWLSGTFPLCDGAHAKHNEETGDNVGPLIVGVKGD